MFVVHYYLKHHHGHRRAKVQNLVRWTRAEYNKVLGACDLLLTPTLSVRADDRGVGRPGRVTGTRLRRNLATVGNCAWRYGRRMTEPVHEVGVNPRSPEPPAAPPRGVDQPTGRGHVARTGSECANGGVPKTLTGFVRRSNVAAGANCVWSRTRSGLPICAASLTVSSFCGPKERELRGGGPSRTGARWFHRFASTVVPDTMSVIGVGTRANWMVESTVNLSWSAICLGSQIHSGTRPAE